MGRQLVAFANVASTITGLAAAAAAATQEAGTATLAHMALVEFPAGDPQACDSQLGGLEGYLIRLGHQPTIRTVTNTILFCGVSFSLDPNVNATAVVQGLPAAIRVHAVESRARAKIDGYGESTHQKAETIHTMTGVERARQELGLTGKGVVVAVLDSGVYYKHPALGGCFGPGCKIAKGYDLVGDDYNGANNLNPDADPFDNCSDISHGTHVAGIVAGDARNITAPGFKPIYPWKGVAPDATIHMYRIFGCTGLTTNDVIVSAIFRAIEDGADIINLSIDNGPNFPEAADAAAVTRAGENGVKVFAAAGNNGAVGLYVAANPAGALGGFSVASFDIADTVRYPLTVSGKAFPWSAGVLNSSFGSPQQLDIFINTPNAISDDVQDDGCASVGAGAAGKSVLVRYGSACDSTTRCTTAQQAGATSCIIYSNDDFLNGVNGSSAIPTASTTQEAGAAILADASSVIISKVATLFPEASAGTVSNFSGGGLDAELHFKPDFGVFGRLVYSTISPHVAAFRGEETPYAYYSGTSMATPYASGMAALLLQHRGKNLSFAEVKTAFQNTAVPAKRYQSSLIDSVALQGAGFLNIYDAATTTTVVSPSFLALNDSVHIKDSYTLTITNKDITPVSFTLTQVGAATANPFNGVEDIVQPRNTTTFTSNHAIVGFGSNRQATLNTPAVPPNSSVNVTVHFSPPPTASPSLHPLYSGHLVVSRYGNATPVARVPYAGVVGNWTAAHILAVSSPSMVRPAGFYLPASTQGNATTFTAITAGATVNLTAHNIALWNSFAGTTRNGIAVVVYTGSDAATRASLVALGLMDAGNRDQGVLNVRGEDGGDLLFMYNDFSARNAPFAGQSVGAPLFYYWGGEVYASESADTYVKLPAGEYKLRLKGLKHFRPRFAQDDADFHIVETPTVHLVY